MTHPTLIFDQQFPGPCVGVDEVGYGPWAGPVVTAAVMIHDVEALRFLEGRVNDSKKLTLAKREALYETLLTHPALHAHVGSSSVEEIDGLNIRKATCLAMDRALAHPGFAGVRAVLVDGTLPLTHAQARVIPIVKGDAQSFTIACASIIAKVTRDRLMIQLHEEFPHYGWNTNVGYGTATHQAGLAAHGVSIHHRTSYAPIKALLGKV